MSHSPARFVQGLCLLALLAGCTVAANDETTGVGALGVEVGATDRNVLLSVDCSLADAVTTQVQYARGWVQPIDYTAAPSDVAADVNNAKRMSPTMTTAVFDLNTRANASMFAYDAATESLTPNTADDGFAARLGAVKAAALPTFVQLSGTPSAAPKSWLDDVAYVARENANGNFYPLPTSASVATVQRAVIDSILAAEKTAKLQGNVWIGTQEPTHTLGFSPDCAAAGASKELKLECRKDNVRRFVAYWKPIAKALRRNGIKVGGIQLNSHDRDLYAFAAQELIATSTPVDAFVIQRYSSYPDLIPNAYEAYKLFQAAHGYEHVKVALTRYSFDNHQTAETRLEFFESAEGMVQILADEKQIMEHAPMMAGYAYQTSGILTPTSLVPRVLSWLQSAPTPLRTVTVANAGTGLESFALVRSGSSPHASIAIWNRGTTPQPIALAFSQSSVPFGAKKLTAVKGSGTTIDPTRVILRGGRITGLTLAPNEFALIDAE